MLELLESWGYWGMLVSSIIAGSVFPFSSEAVLTALLLAGLDPFRLFVAATVGNVVGSMFNYLRVDPEKVRRTSAWMERYGAWIGVLCFLPIVGSVIAVTLGFARANPWLSLLTITIGKAARYALLIFAVGMI